MEFEPVDNKATDEQIKAAVEFCTGIPSADVFIYIPEAWREIGTFWGAGKRFGEWDIDGNTIMVIECAQEEDAVIVVHEESPYDAK